MTYRGDLAPVLGQALHLFRQLSDFRGLDSEREYLEGLLLEGIEARAGRVATHDELTRARTTADMIYAADLAALCGLEGEPERVKLERQRLRYAERKSNGTLTLLDVMARPPKAPDGEPLRLR